mmetsp:Transcript_9985/g.22368  ORF Transcript_9985/g.22368 Transcript_9985/m.22368 type:complete len:163 (-) Transcript_9985:459-947(-)
MLKTGHVQTTEFWTDPRDGNHCKLNTKYSDAKIKSSDVRVNKYHQPLQCPPPVGEDIGDAVGHPTMRSKTQETEDWVIDSDSFEIKKIAQRSLSCYTLEQILVSEDNSKFLLLMSVGNNNNLFEGKGGAIGKRIVLTRKSARDKVPLKRDIKPNFSCLSRFP